MDSNEDVRRFCGSRRDEEEREDLDSHEKLDAFVGPGEIKRREVVLDPQVSPEEIKSREVKLSLNVGLLLRQLFPNSRATDIVFVTLFRTAVGTAIAWYTSCCTMAKRTLP